ncbi:hypothetical protein QBZ16_004477 [Prototheca wickerhamii]|uniref:Uncharacterized protein n=1 Tax=Prototheca wickerhamii TaxID=3111 RepID=A0AAD9IFU0_PROWI|nr:hypothetical protein QBZ16_004477 [Prototheca wickerhamii]
MKLTTTAFYETKKVHPLDDIALSLSASAELAVFCYSTWYKRTEWYLFSHIPSVDLPDIWYYPLTTDMGTWPLQAGDELICELWECDGAETGCDPSRPTAVPDANAGDDYLGLLRLPMSAYKSDMSITTTFNDTKNAAVATVMLECDGCWATLRNNATWVNPYTPGEMPDYMMVNAPAASPPPPPSPVPQDAASETESQAGTSANLHITVEQPSHAVPLMRAANTASANVYTPWAPKMTRAV